MIGDDATPEEASRGSRMAISGHGARRWSTVAIVVVALSFIAGSVSIIGHAAFLAHPQRASNASAAATPGANGYLSVSILDLHTGRERYEGEAVEVLGRIHILTDSDARTLPEAAKAMDVRAILYRYAITCCVTDAVPLSAVLQGVDVGTLRDDAWYKVRGRARFVAEGVDVPFVHVDSLQEIPEPISPYLNATDTLFSGQNL